MRRIPFIGADAGRRIVLAALIGPGLATAQPAAGLGSIGGRIVLEETGTALQGAEAMALLIDRSPVSPGLRPVGRAYADRQGRYSISGLKAGDYVICVKALGSDLLKTCDWGQRPESVKLNQGQVITTADQAVARGRRVEIEVKDPGGHLDKNEVRGSGVHLMVGVWSSSRSFHPAKVLSKGKQARTYAVVVPFGRVTRLEVSGKKLDVEDDKGKLKRDDEPLIELNELRNADRAPKKVSFQVRGVKP